MPRLARRAVLVAVALSIALASAASASRRATRNEREQIVHAFRPHISLPAYEYKLRVRVSTADSHFGAAYIRPRSGYENVVMPDQASFRKKNGHWHYRGRGGCGLPSAVKQDLHLFCF